MNATTSLIVLAGAAVSLSSCVVTDYPGGPANGSVSTTFGIYDTLPNTYVGDAYYYRNTLAQRDASIITLSAFYPMVTSDHRRFAFTLKNSAYYHSVVSFQ